MLQAKGVSKAFDGSLALDKLDCIVPSGACYGIVGSNGAGKSTLLRLFAGVYKPDAGEVILEGKIRLEGQVFDERGFHLYGKSPEGKLPIQIFEHPEAKEQIILVPDELYFLPQASLTRMAKLYANAFPHFSREHFHSLVNLFQLPPRKAIRTFSKGMKRQAAIILALAAKPRYLLLDEAFDGLDPTMRDLVRKIITYDIAQRGTTVVISSHSLRELEDTCDWLALLHQGRLIFEGPKTNLMSQAPQGLEALFVERLKQAGYSFDAALSQIYAQASYAQEAGWTPPPVNPYPSSMPPMPPPPPPTSQVQTLQRMPQEPAEVYQQQAVQQELYVQQEGDRN